MDYQGSANGTKTYDVISPENGYGAQTLRVYAPRTRLREWRQFPLFAPSRGGAWEFYGDGLATLRSLDAEDQYNLTIVEPTFAYQPWYTNNASDPSLHTSLS